MDSYRGNLALAFSYQYRCECHSLFAFDSDCSFLLAHDAQLLECITEYMNNIYVAR